MKRILSTILLCVTILCAYSQEDITLFFLNDGSFKGFYDEEIDSITYSHLDLDSVWHSDAVVQEVWLADSVVRIPIEKIDSICHKVPDPEYKPGVIHLDERYLPYITSVDGLTISFSSGLSENLWPKEGSVLLYEGSNNIFPNGFAGTVTKLVDGVAVCDSAAVDDVYERLYFFGSYVLAEDGEGTGTYSAKKIRSRHADDKEDDWGIFEVDPTNIPFDKIKIAEKIDISRANMFVAISGTITPTVTVEAAYVFNVYEPLIFFKATHRFEYDALLQVGFNKDFTPKHHKDIGKPFRMHKLDENRDEKGFHLYFINESVPIPQCPVLTAGFKMGLFIDPKIEAEVVLGLHIQASEDKTHIYRLDKNNIGRLGEWWKGNGPEPETSSCEIELDGSLTGSVWAGLMAAINVGVGTDKCGMKEELSARIGPYIEGKLNLDFMDLNKDMSWYSGLKDSKIKRGIKSAFNLDFTAKMPKVFSYKWTQLELSPPKLFFEQDCYLLPAFEAPTYSVQGNSLKCYTSVTRSTVPNHIGLRVKDESGKEVTKWQNFTFDFADKDNPYVISETFDNLDFANHRYTIIPVTRIWELPALEIPEPSQTCVTCPDSRHPHLIDLGLPSGTKWLCQNVYADDPKDAGGYYQWGKPFMVHAYTDLTYRAPSSAMANYQSSEHDAATANLGQEYCTPTMSQFNELHDNCSMDYKYSPWGNNVLGVFLKGKNGNNLYLPFSGFKSGVKVNNKSEGCFLSSDAVDSDNNLQRKAVVIKNNDAIWHSTDALAYGYSVRPVSAGRDGLVIEPQQLDFEVYVGQEVGQYVTIANNGSTPVNITVAQTIAPFRVDDASLGTFTVKPKDRLSVLVYFSPTEKIEYTSVLTLSYETGNACVVSKVPLKGKGINAGYGESLITVSPQKIDFGEVVVGLSKSEVFTIKNVSTENVKFTIRETHGEIDIYDSGKEFKLASGEEKTFIVSYRPISTNNSFSSRTYIEINAEEGMQYIDFSGSSIAPNYDSAELIFNGDFSLGAVGFTSDYGYVSETGSRALWDEGKYSVGINPSYYHTGWINRGDHSSGTGNMLIVNGNIDNSKYVWKQSVYVEKGKTYEFSAWFIDVSNGIDKNAIEYNIGGTSNKGEYDKTENGWDRYYWRYTATETGQIMLKIRTMSAAAGGNDFAIDDISFTRKTSELVYLSCPDDNHPHIIHMGIAGKWACCNAGASAPWEYGGYYAWGETEEKDCYDWNTYIHCDGSGETCHNLGDDISGTQYDVAHVKWGGKWCMPTADQFDLLDDYSAKEHTIVNGIRGIKYTSTTGGSIFIPDGGLRRNDEVLYAGEQGYNWLSSLEYDDDNSKARYAYGHFTAGGGISTGNRCDGKPIRPVIAYEDNNISCPDDNHPHVIDMGIAGKWACCNVGASAPWAIGGHYSWGKTTETDCSIYDIDIDITGTKYDIAHVEWGDNWCMPSFNQLRLLRTSCINMQKTINGINGIMFTAPNGNSIFLPAAGCRWDNSVHYIGEEGDYWSTTIRATDGCPYYLHIYGSGSGVTFYGNYRSDEYSVRPVINPKGKPDNDVGGSPGNGDGTSGGSDPTHDEYDDF